MEVAVVIPAYQPGLQLVQVVHSLLESPIHSVIVIDDGSGRQHENIFQQVRSLPRVVVLEHPHNLGKGAALKTGIDYVLHHFPGDAGVITADADGQHHPKDILGVAQRFMEVPDSLVLGSRNFSSRVPWRNSLGNRITRRVVGWTIGLRLVDTQTGLRAIPQSLLPRLLKIPSTGYEFELEMLIVAKRNKTPIVEHRIQTLYARDNPSHFNPLVDSLKIYFVLLRYLVPFADRNP